jgi:hypothetical protein
MSKILVGFFIVTALTQSALNIAGVSTTDVLNWHSVGWEATR